VPPKAVLDTNVILSRVLYELLGRAANPGGGLLRKGEKAPRETNLNALPHREQRAQFTTRPIRLVNRDQDRPLTPEGELETLAFSACVGGGGTLVLQLDG